MPRRLWAIQHWWLMVRTLAAMARQKPWQPLLIVVAIMVATGGLSSVSLINAGASQGELANTKPGLLSGAMVVARSPEHSITRADYVALRKAGFTQLIAISRDSGPLRCGSAPASGRGARDISRAVEIIGIDTLAMANAHLPLAHALADAANSTAAPQPIPGSVSSVSAASPALVSRLDCPGGISRDSGIAIRPPTPLTQIPDNTIVVPLAAFYTGNYTLHNRPISALVAATPLSPRQQNALTRQLPVHLKFKPPPAIQQPGTLSDSFQLNLWAMGMLMAVVALFIVLNALTLMYRSRLPQLVRLRQLGVGRYSLINALLGELALYCALATPAGVLAGVALTRQLTPTLSSTFANLFNAPFVRPSPLLAELLLSAFAISFAALAVFFVVPARQLGGALNRRSRRTTPLNTAQRLCITAVIVVVNSVAILTADSTLWALISVALVLLGGSLLIILWLPGFTRLLVRGVPPDYPLAGYVVASTYALSAKSRLAVCAFFIALSANIGMNVMTDSFRQATKSWLTQRLAAPAYLYSATPPSPSQVGSNITARISYRGYTQVNGAPVTVRSVSDDKTSQDSLALSQQLPNAWTLFSQNQAVLINQQMALRQHLAPGAKITLGSVRVKDQVSPHHIGSAERIVAGVYLDYGNPDAQLLLPLSVFAPAAGFAGVTALYNVDGADLSALKAFGELYETSALITTSMATFDRTFVLTDALNIVTLLVAALAFAISVSVLTLDLQPQLTLLRTLGVRQWQIKAALGAQYMLLCTATAMVALPFGIGLAGIFIYQVNRFAFSWVYPLQLSAQVLISSVLFSLAVILVVLLLPLGRLNNKVDLRQEGAG